MSKVLSYSVSASLTMGVYLKACIITKHKASFLALAGYRVNCFALQLNGLCNIPLSL